MKFKTLFFIAILIVGVFLLFNYLPENILSEKLGKADLSGIFDKFSGDSGQVQNKLGYSSDVVTTNDASLVTMEFEVLHESMLNLMYEKAMETYENTGKDFIRVESFYESEPIFALSGSGDNPGNYVMEDIRSPEYAIQSELPVFNVLVENLKLTESDIELDLDYMGAENEFSDSVYAILLTVLENAGWVDDIILNFRLPDGILKVSTTAKSITDSLEGQELTFDSEFIIIKGNEESKDSGSISNEDCTDSEKAYEEYIEAYNKLTDLMNKGKRDTPEAEEAYEEYKKAKDCYDQSVK